MSEQSYATHRRFVPGYHFVLLVLGLLTLVGSIYNLYRAIGRGNGRGEAILVLLLAVCLAMAAYYLRMFALKAQDRAIRAEENLRHYLLYGSPLDARLDIRQIIGLRFAGDEEFGDLAKRAAEDGLSEDEIKKSVASWRGDFYRV
ncbi:MAG: DUF6526 family protein [Alphaproteobacteria bacterium]|nr:DUF6526 family protein [Alphaproteobacteria bacterium]